MTFSRDDDTQSIEGIKYSVTDAGNYTAEVTMKQEQDGWQSTISDIGGIAVTASGTGAVKGKGTATITYTASNGKTTIDFS